MCVLLQWPPSIVWKRKESIVWRKIWDIFLGNECWEGVSNLKCLWYVYFCFVFKPFNFLKSYAIKMNSFKLTFKCKNSTTCIIYSSTGNRVHSAFYQLIRIKTNVVCLLCSMIRNLHNLQWPGPTSTNP